MDYGLLILRLFVGGTMFFSHGLQKVLNYSAMLQQFPDILGIGVAGNLGLVIFAEFFCSALVIVGLFTRMAVIPLIINMSVAFFVAHAADPFGRKELPFLYLGCFLVLLFTGPGRISVQQMFKISAGRFQWLLK